jgi:predicted enzyme related to lactoylglutathione lyase
MANSFVHIELNTTDLDKAKAFYGNLFAWTLDDIPMGDGSIYTLIKVGENSAGGMMKHPMPGAPSLWIPYVLVDDVAAETERAKSLGATIIRDKTEVREWGGLASFSTRLGHASRYGRRSPGRSSHLSAFAEAFRRRAECFTGFVSCDQRPSRYVLE